VGLFGFLRKKDERAIPEPGTPEFDEAVRGSALPDAQSVSMGEAGWAKPDAAQPSQTVDLSGTGARDQVLQALREHGIDPDKKDQTIDATGVPGLQESIFRALGRAGVQIPGAGGFGGGIAPPRQDPLDQVAYLAKQRDAGQISEAEFEAQKRKLLGS
jgi:hypothetical protein